VPQSPHRSVAAILAAIVLVAACSGAGTPSPAGSAASPQPAASGVSSPGGSDSGSAAASPSTTGSVTPTSLTVGLGYIPNVQFAPFYLADQKGYYAAEGLKVAFQNEIDANLVPKVGQGQVDLGLADGTSVIPAVSQGIPLKYVATIYGKFPSIVFSKASTGITSAASLKGRKIGIPGKYGSSWVMLQALLGSAGLKPSDATIVEYPDFGQGAAVAAGAVDAATGFVNNEPVQLELAGTKTSVLTVDQITPLPGPGIIASTATISSKRDAIAGFIRATLKAMNEIVADPSVGVDATAKAVPETAKDPATQAAVLAATIAAWAPPGAPAGAPLTGAIDPGAWDTSATYMATLGMVPKPVTSSDLVDTSFTAGS
jgi:NitT/TauT family transport system substrate-binding protein